MSIDIRFENVFFNYAQSSFGLKDISFSINKGERVAICGVNGAGKTTLLKLLMGIEFPKRGKIYVQDLELKSNNLKEIRKKVGFVFQNPDSQVFSASVYEDVAFGPRNYGYKEEEVEEMVKKALKILEEKINTKSRLIIRKVLPTRRISCAHRRNSPRRELEYGYTPRGTRRDRTPSGNRAVSWHRPLRDRKEWCYTPLCILPFPSR